MAFVLANAQMRRLRGKQLTPAQYLLPGPALTALTDEAWSKLTALSDDARRKQVHYVHVRTHNPAHQQPDSFIREGFWRHMVQVYKDVYPDPSHQRTGSILMFGKVVREKHAVSTKQQERDEHHHCVVYTSTQHYWNRVAARSLELGVKLHAATHDGYTIMYVYVSCPSPKKPVAEIDRDGWYSEDHPRGSLLQRLLEVGTQATRRFQKSGGAVSREPEPGSQAR